MLSTIYILWLRQIKRYIRSKSRIIGSLGQPILFLLALGYGFGPVFQQAGKGNYINFLVPGVVGMGIIFTAIFSGIEVIWDRQFGFLKETLVAPVSRYNIMIGRTLGGATVAVMQGVVVFLLSLLTGFHPVSWAVMPLVLLVMFLVAILFTALGTAIASRLEDMQGFQLIMNFLVMPLFFLSGSLFPLGESGQGVIGTIAKFDPLSYGIDAMRGLLVGGYHFGLGTDITVLSLITIVFVIIGGYLFSKIEI
ncbi:MAG: ABC transporter permease [Candidatus Pacebacteria bacterium]|nr:ABC transporter permease [Candidatus Paceibacterota bacterium]MDD5357238.1 ABC transporter permease [Candidatus Paceibacterota bacterium]